MLTIEEITTLIENDKMSVKKRRARKAQNYYEGKHDILKYRLFYYNSDGVLTEDRFRSNIRISHPFFTELVDQSVQYTLSGGSFVKSDEPALQAELDKHFNEGFNAELMECMTDTKVKGFSYLYCYKNADGVISFQNADSLGVVEVEARFASDGQDHIIYWYIDFIDKDQKAVKRIMDWTATETYFYQQRDNGHIEKDTAVKHNPKPHTIINIDGTEYAQSFGFVPFFRLDNNKAQVSALAPIKDLIDDYDLMASSLSNNLVDFDTPIHIIKGFQGDNLDELQMNLKTKKMVGVDDDGGVEIKTVDVPYQARKEKLELDEKNIYRFGFGLNISGLKDTAATTNIAIKAAYSLLDLQALKFETRLKQFLARLVKVVLDDINTTQGTDYRLSQVYFDFKHDIISNTTENTQNELTEAQKKQTEINTLLGLESRFDNEALMQLICEQLDIDFEEIKGKIKDPNEDFNDLNRAARVLSGDE